ncbi:MAG TPA: 50S ribosomal protein L22, partial [Candidatus Norongarragalinales archaeon]|nr:50S ribosomal protein L22 [Candidatus Norongarragalinales archaeon]
AQVHDLDASYKDLTQVCRAVKGKSVRSAFSVLENAVNLTHAIEYRKFNKGMGHRSELSGRKGRYPKKECRMVRDLLKNAVANAKNAGLEEGALYVSHAAAHKQQRFKRHRHHWPSGVTLGYGKQATWADYETARVELFVSSKGKPHAAKNKDASGGSPAVTSKPKAKKRAPATLEDAAAGSKKNENAETQSVQSVPKPVGEKITTDKTKVTA